MSRIYEALQRADRERKAAQGPDVERAVEPMQNPRAMAPEFSAVAEPVFESDSDIEMPSSVLAAFNLDSIERKPWKPFLPFFPTLGERNVEVEQFRRLRSRVYQARAEASLQSILVSSGLPNEGKSFIAANLAMSLARNSVKSVLLIDGDLRRPTLHNLLGVSGTPGLSDYLAGTAELRQILHRCSVAEVSSASVARALSNLAFIPAGSDKDNSSELAANKRIKELITLLSPHFDWIIIDSPPVLAVTDAVDLAAAADAVLLVARSASTSFDVAQRAQEAFSKSRILGFALNAATGSQSAGYYSYYYGEQDPSSGAQRREDK